MHPIIGWLAANPYEALGLAYVALGALNALLPHKGDDASALRRLLDWLAPLVPAKFSGTLKPPLRASRPGDGPPVPPAALVLVALALGGCSHEARGVGIVLATILGAGACLAMLAMQVAAFRARRLEDASDAREVATPHLVPLSDEHARAIAHAIEAKARRRSGIPPALALALLSASMALPMASGCHLSPQTRAGLAFVAVAPSIEAGISEYARWRLVEEKAIGDDAVAHCLGVGTADDYRACTEASVKPRRARLDDVRLAVGAYAAAVDAAVAGSAGDLPGAARLVVEALARVGIRVAQEDRR